MDDLTFTLSESRSGGCQVEAFSTSRIWFVNADQYHYDNDRMWRKEEWFVTQVCSSWPRDKLLQSEKSDRWCRVRERKYKKNIEKTFISPSSWPKLSTLKSFQNQYIQALQLQHKEHGDYLQVKQWQRVFRGDFHQEMHSVRCEGLLAILTEIECK